MKAITMLRLAESIQLLRLDGYDEFTLAQLSNTSGISTKTLQRDPDLIRIIDFASNRKDYHRCLVYI